MTGGLLSAALPIAAGRGGAHEEGDKVSARLGRQQKIPCVRKARQAGFLVGFGVGPWSWIVEVA